jgi:hypothetical protein
MAKYITTVLKVFSPWVLDKLSYDLTYYIYVCRRFAR